MAASSKIDSLSPESSPVRVAHLCRSHPRGSIDSLSPESSPVRVAHLCRSHPRGSIDSLSPESLPVRVAHLCRSHPRGSIVDLRNLLAERFPHVPAPAGTLLITGLSFLDRAI